MDDHYAPQPIARWYIFAAVASLLFMLLRCVAIAMDLTTDPATLPLDQRALFEAEPAWVLAITAVGVVVGTLGALLLVLRRKAAEPLLLVSLITVVAWLAGIFVTPMRDVLSTTDIVVILIVAALTWTIYWFARHSRQRGWLR